MSSMGALLRRELRLPPCISCALTCNIQAAPVNVAIRVYSMQINGRPMLMLWTLSPPAWTAAGQAILPCGAGDW